MGKLGLFIFDTKTAGRRSAGLTAAGKTFDSIEGILEEIMSSYNRIGAIPHRFTTSEIGVGEIVATETDYTTTLAICSKDVVGDKISLFVLYEENDNDFFVICAMPISAQKIEDNLATVNVKIPKLICHTNPNK